VLDGGTGTLLELAKVWELKNKGFLPADRPIILVGDFWRPLVELIARDDPDAARQVKIVKDAQQAVQLLAEDIGLR
jgi:predicted Rossmann-fold nucleotide-binding protein